MNFAKQTEFATVASLYHRLALDFASHFLCVYERSEKVV